MSLEDEVWELYELVDQQADRLRAFAEEQPTKEAWEAHILCASAARDLHGTFAWLAQLEIPTTNIQ